MGRLLNVLAFACAFALALPSARAEDRSEALVREGNALRRDSRNEEALPKFEEAYRLVPTPRTATQIGLCKEALGRWAEAEEMIGAALLAKDDEWITKNRSVLDQALATIKDHVGSVAVVGEPDGAEVVVAGRVRGRLPLGGPVHVDAGSVDIEVRAPGYESASRTLTVAAHAYQTVVLNLKKAVESVSTGPASRATVALAQPPRPQPEPQALVTSGDSGPGPEAASAPLYRRPWFWGVVGGVVAAGVVATLLLTRKTSYPSSNLSETFP